MKFYIMHRGLFEEIPASERRNHATFFAASNKRTLKSRVKFFFGQYAADTRLSRIGKQLDSFAGKLRIKVCGPAVFLGRPIEVEKIGGSAWSQGGDWYLKTEIVPGRLDCYSWIADISEKDPLCVSFEILEEEKDKK